MPSENSCYTTAGKYCACIEFHLDEYHRHGFNSNQLIEYSLEPNPDADDDKNAAPQKLTIAFSTADVLLLGSNLGLLADKLRENDLASVHVQPKRYSGIDRNAPFVTVVKITPIK
jgi:hypothetical protein